MVRRRTFHAPDADEVRGRFGRVIARGERAFTVARFRTTADEITVAGRFAAGDLRAAEVTLWGRWKAGGAPPIFQVRKIWRGTPFTLPDPPPAGVDALLVAIFRGKRFGPASVRRLRAHFGETTWRVLTREPEILARHLPPERALDLHRTLLGVGLSRATALAHLMGVGLSLAYAKRALRALGVEAIEMVHDDPYRLIGVPGVRFATADRIARSGFGVSEGDPRRLLALVLSILEDAADNGDTSLPEAEALRRLRSGGHLPSAGGPPVTLVDALAADGRVVRCGGDLYLPRMFSAETRAAEALARLVLRPRRHLPFEVEHAPDLVGYDREQRRAVHVALTSAISLITGRPGSGKTAVAREIARMALRLGLKIHATATTGRAADRLSAALSHPGVDGETLPPMPARTIQSLVGARGDGRKLPAGLVLVDEVSMADLPLFARIVGNAGDNTSVVLIGDSAQLPSVLAGAVSRDLAAVRDVPVVELTGCYRQDRGSLIRINADLIRDGHAPVFHGEKASSPMLAYLGRENIERRDVDWNCYFRDALSPETAADKVVDTVRRLVGLGYDAATDVQVFTPMHRGVLGTRHLNHCLQERMNPRGSVVREIGTLGFPLSVPGGQPRSISPAVGTCVRLAVDDPERGRVRGEDGVIEVCAPNGALTVRFDDGVHDYPRDETRRLRVRVPTVMRVGDPVIQTTADPERDLFNGMRGRIVEGGAEGCVVEFSGRRVEYDADEMARLRVAYAVTVHKGQGQEVPVGIFVLHPSEHHIMYDRSLVLVAQSRARRKAVFVGRKWSLRKAVSHSSAAHRHTRLSRRTSEIVREARAHMSKTGRIPPHLQSTHAKEYAPGQAELFSA